LLLACFSSSEGAVISVAKWRPCLSRLFGFGWHSPPEE
jgi:hypothetical protein